MPAIAFAQYQHRIEIRSDLSRAVAGVIARIGFETSLHRSSDLRPRTGASANKEVRLKGLVQAYEVEIQIEQFQSLDIAKKVMKSKAFLPSGKLPSGKWTPGGRIGDESLCTPRNLCRGVCELDFRSGTRVVSVRLGRLGRLQRGAVAPEMFGDTDFTFCEGLAADVAARLQSLP